VDYLFASHFLDALTRADGENLLREARRVLRPGGLLRLVVSDMALNVALYASGRREEALLRFFPVSSSRPNLLVLLMLDSQKRPALKTRTLSL